jgi:hypothetical protein
VIKIIPFLVETALQCGCWFMRQHPRHKVSAVLREIPMFPQSALLLVKGVDIIQKNHTKKLVENLNKKLAHVVGSLQSKVQQVNTRISLYHECLKQQSTNIHKTACGKTLTKFNATLKRQDNHMTSIVNLK